jgi:biotin carboxyl carrier protein
LLIHTQDIIPKRSGADATRSTQHVTAYVSADGVQRWVTVNGQTVVLTRASGAPRKSSGPDHASDLTAPMPGLVRSVNVVEGETVTKGQTLMVLEAMKMEIRIQAKNDGVVKRLFVKQGQTVEREQVLIEIE